MTLDEIRAAQHMERRYQSDEHLEMFLDELNPQLPILDLLPHTEVERLHLTHVRAAA